MTELSFFSQIRKASKTRDTYVVTIPKDFMKATRLPTKKLLKFRIEPEATISRRAYKKLFDKEPPSR